MKINLVQYERIKLHFGIMNNTPTQTDTSCRNFLLSLRLNRYRLTLELHRGIFLSLYDLSFVSNRCI